MTYVHVVHGWVWKWGQQVGGDANWPCLGGSSGGDDLLCLCCIYKVLIIPRSLTDSLAGDGPEERGGSSKRPPAFR